MKEALNSNRRKMICDYCQVEMSERHATMANPYQYTLSGLKNVCLAGIDVRKCEKCGHVLPVIPHIAQLHDAIARFIVKEPRSLRGDEVRFLRKIAGFPARKFATLLGITPEHLSRFENGHTKKLGKVADRLARFIAIKAKDGEDSRELFLQIADRLDPELRPKETTEQPCFELKRAGWKEAA